VILDIKVTLDSGGTVTIHGDDLTAEGVNEVFAILGGYTIESTGADPLVLDEPVTESMKTAFVEGFDEGRTGEKE
jgi:hypothetical protein